MRLPAGLLYLGLLATLAGCQSQTTSDVLSVGTSSEKTGAIAMPAVSIPSTAAPKTARAPIAPPAAVPGHASAPALAMATPPQPPVPFETAQPQLIPAVAEPMARPAAEKANFIVPTSPTGAGSMHPRSRMPIYSQRFRDAKPINFGRTSPRAYAVHGVDVSRWQGDIDWAKLRTQGANFAFIKATDGGDHTDPMFKTNWHGAKAAGLKRGAYHFFYWCRTAGEQADWFIRNVPRDPEALPPVIRRRMEPRFRLPPEAQPEAGARQDESLHGKGRAPLRQAPDHLHGSGFLRRQPAGCLHRLSLLAARRGPASLEGLSEPPLGLLAIFRIGPLARCRRQDRPERLLRQRRGLAPLGGVELR